MQDFGHSACDSLAESTRHHWQKMELRRKIKKELGQHEGFRMVSLLFGNFYCRGTSHLEWSKMEQSQHSGSTGLQQQMSHYLPRI